VWTTLPSRMPWLTAWVGGPKAAALCVRGEAAIIGRALDSLESLFGTAVDARSLLEAAHVHDWQADPFARGAYSYVTVGGSGAHDVLAEPLEDTLFFAGEAADTSGQSATVAGALASGKRAATEVLDAAAGTSHA
jgi:monoamine oxidase